MKTFIKWVIYVMLVLLLCSAFVCAYNFIKGCTAGNVEEAFYSAYSSIFCTLLFFILVNMLKVSNLFQNMDTEGLHKKVKVFVDY